MKHFLAVCCLVLSLATGWSQDNRPPVRFAVIGLSHDHASGFLGSKTNWHGVELAGIVESDPKLIATYTRNFHLDASLFYPTLKDLLAKTRVDAVWIFTSTFEHRRLVEEATAAGIKTVMMEKPLAVNMEHARAIEAAARNSGANVLVNYETTWYPANQAAYRLVHDDHALGDIRKFVSHYGHQGPKEIRCSETFVNWLTDPVQNGGGALNDFGCYGADQITWFMDGQRPLSVTAVAQHIKPDVYPKVEDEATIILTYPKAQGIIQASWNWPYGRKDMEIYATGGSAIIPTPTPNVVRVKRTSGREITTTAPTPTGPDLDQTSYLAAVVRGDIKPGGPSCLAVNMIVIEILDAAQESARTGRRIDLVK